MIDICPVAFILVPLADDQLDKVHFYRLKLPLPYFPSGSFIPCSFSFRWPIPFFPSASVSSPTDDSTYFFYRLELSLPYFPSDSFSRVFFRLCLPIDYSKLFLPKLPTWLRYRTPTRLNWRIPWEARMEVTPRVARSARVCRRLKVFCS